MLELATRAYNHTFRFDPVVRSLLDVDFYKFLMMNAIYTDDQMKNANVTFKVTFRKEMNPLFTNVVSRNEFIEQLQYVQKLRFEKNELIWLSGNTFYGISNLFRFDFIEYLKTLQLPEVDVDENWINNANPNITVKGNYLSVTLWETILMSIINDLYYRAIMRDMSKIQLDMLYSNAKVELVNGLSNVVKNTKNISHKQNPLKISEFGTRRRHSYLWQEWVVNSMKEILTDDHLVGTSNAYIAMKTGLEAVGTNAHELPMVAMVLAMKNIDITKPINETERMNIFNNVYNVPHLWEKVYNDNLKVLLPDTYGTTEFLKHLPNKFNDWGIRVDSKPDHLAIPENINFWKSKNINPFNQLTLLSDGLNWDDITRTYNQYSNQLKIAYGIGTNATNNFTSGNIYMTDSFRDLVKTSMKSLNVVCKVCEVDNIPAIKLSDNPNKNMGDKKYIDFYKKIFNYEN